ncbi:hypothetical protein [Amycolatopsis sp. lyj-90]|uniref:hypothetical protein n=1 Tax=Amycolatopsis sp. lyj-90 TaxID=2789285 RepID=UPI003977FE6F
MVGTVVGYGTVGGEINAFASTAARGIDNSQNLRNALWLNGRANRAAADVYMIYEYAEREFIGTKGISSALGLSSNWQARLTRSANKLSPLKGGRHANDDTPIPLTLVEQQEYAAALLRRWLATYA